jgi:hypothetical protein
MIYTNYRKLKSKMRIDQLSYVGSKNFKNLLLNGAFLTNFVFAKLFIYFLPLIIAARAPASFYGALELGLAVGLLVAGLTIGTPFGGLTRLFLVHKNAEVVDVAWSALSCVLAFCCLVVILAWLTQLQLVIFTSSMLALSMLQSAGSSWFRMLGMRNSAAWVDGLAVLVSATILAGAWFWWGQPDLMRLARLHTTLTFAALAFSVAMVFRTRRPQLYRRLVDSTKVGFPMMFVGAMSIWLGVGGRIIFGFVNATDLAIYSIAFRIAGLALGFHQLLITAAFAKLYTARTRNADRVMGRFIAVIGVASIVTSVAAPFIVQHMGLAALRPGDMALLQGILPYACAHTLFWIAHALLQLRLNRLGFSSHAALPTGVALVGGTAAIIGFGYFISESAVFLSALIASQAAIYFAISCYVLHRRRFYHWVVMSNSFLFGAILFAIGLISSFFGIQ